MQKSDLSKLARDYNSFDKSLKESGYSRFERGVVYTGLGLGMLAPVVAVRYFVMPPTDSPVLDALCWVASVGVNVFSTIGLRGFPLIYSGGAGAFGGGVVAFGVKKWREGRRGKKQERRLEIKD